MCLREKLTLGGVIVAMQRVKGGEEKIPPKKVRNNSIDSVHKSIDSSQFPVS